MELDKIGNEKMFEMRFHSVADEWRFNLFGSAKGGVAKVETAQGSRKYLLVRPW